MRHEVRERAEARVGRDAREVGHLGRVEARVLLHLLRPARVLVSGLEDAAPARVEGLVLREERLAPLVRDALELRAQLALGERQHLKRRRVRRTTRVPIRRRVIP